MAHPSFPWQDEAISVCLHKPNVYIDLSGWSPKYFSPTLVQYADTLLREKVLFGSDYPMITPDRWLRDFAALPLRDEVRPLILKENAARLLGLRAAAARRAARCGSSVASSRLRSSGDISAGHAALVLGRAAAARARAACARRRSGAARSRGR